MNVRIDEINIKIVLKIKKAKKYLLSEIVFNLENKWKTKKMNKLLLISFSKVALIYSISIPLIQVEDWIG